jgi:hypothetical protein
MAESTEHVFLVGFIVDAETREQALLKLGNTINDSICFGCEVAPDESQLERHPVRSWWTAEDDRLDSHSHSNDSAVFVKKGKQVDASQFSQRQVRQPVTPTIPHIYQTKENHHEQVRPGQARLPRRRER